MNTFGAFLGYESSAVCNSLLIKYSIFAQERHDVNIGIKGLISHSPSSVIDGGLIRARKSCVSVARMQSVDVATPLMSPNRGGERSRVYASLLHLTEAASVLESMRPCSIQLRRRAFSSLCVLAPFN